MKFVRENMFLIIMAAVVVLGGGGMVAAYFKTSGQVRAGIAMRIEMVDKLRGLGNQGANTEMVRKAEEAMLGIEKAAKEVKSMCIDWNRRTYRVLQLNVPESTEVVPAFPYDAERYRDNNLGYVFTRTYVQAMQELLNGLNPTSPPTQAEIQSQTLQWENQLTLQRTMEASTAGPQVGAGGAAVGGWMGTTRTPIAPMSPDTWGAGTAEVPPDVAQQAMAMGRQSAMLNKAKTGEIYVDANAIDMVFREAMLNPPVEQLWRAQLKLWVIGDIVAAIKATNDEAFAAAKQQGKPANVLTAAVKRVVQIRVNANYVRPPAADAAAAPVTSEYYSGETPDYEAPEASSGGPAVMGPGLETFAPPDLLTGRGSNQEYDVLHYQFTVVMPTRYLLALERNLMARNQHTILKVEFSQPDAVAGAYAPTPSLGVAGNTYYYGVEPVVQVDIAGELLLLTAWERGMAEVAEGEQPFPPLVPPEVLARQFAAPSDSALRAEDTARLPQQAIPEGYTP